MRLIADAYDVPLYMVCPHDAVEEVWLSRWWGTRFIARERCIDCGSTRRQGWVSRTPWRPPSVSS